MAISLVILLGGCDYFGKDHPSQNPNDPACQIQASQEHAPGWPYDLAVFRTQILPVLISTCGTAGCHAAPQGNGGLTVWADAAPGNCSYAKTFNSFIQKVDLVNPGNSGVYVAVTGGDPLHPLKMATTDPTAQLLLSFVTQASQTQSQAGGGGNPPPPAASPFDYNVFQTAIQPILDTAENKGCTNGNCHGAPAGQNGFKLVAMPAPSSSDMLANFNAVTARCDLNTPDQSKFYLQATIRHANGASAVVTGPQATQMLGWIQQAKANAAAGGGGGACAPPDSFNLGVFRAEIQPILFGTIDLNNRTSGRTTTGCARVVCHGADRTGGALVLKQDADPAINLQNFTCFVNLTNPTASDILLCPLNQPGCRHYPHPGQDVFAGAQDLNYQRVLSYLYAAKTVATPLDFAFYVRQIDTIFNDVNSVQGGAQNRSCSDTVSCHGITVAGQPPPNRSNFPILANASGKDKLLFNFSSASNFTNFITPTGSSLFMYPTDEISNLSNPFATGLHHPGGADFATNSSQAVAILSWARGLRPDGQGFQPNWLVAGDYSAAAVTDATVIDEINAKPTLFDADGASQFNNGQWDASFAGGTTVDLNQSFPRASTSGRVAYAVAYILNTSTIDIQAQITVVSANAIKLYVGQQPVVQADNAQAGVTGLAVLPAYATAKSSTRLLLKVFQHATDGSFNFSVRLQDQYGNALTNVTGELVVKLSPDGGI
ncbi:MAG TPA: hypothetical protein VKN99_27050 [Polyangia bacterium]|nr:hypothetical protein [Polyangia bacterium]